MTQRFRCAAWLVAVGIALAPLTVRAEYYDKFGFSSADVQRYSSVSNTIASCRLASALDDHDLHKVSVALAPRLATLYGQCRAALKAQREPLGVMRVNDMFLGLQCLTITMNGYDASAIPACNLPSSLPKPSR